MAEGRIEKRLEVGRVAGKRENRKYKEEGKEMEESEERQQRAASEESAAGKEVRNL